MTLEGADTSSSGEKRPRRSPSYEEAQQDQVIVLVGSPDLASNDQTTLGVSLNEANIPLEGEVPVVRPPNVEEVRMGAPSGVVIAPASSPKPTGTGPIKKRFPDRVIISTYVPPLERVRPSLDMEALDLEDVMKITRCYNPLNKEESPVTRMHDLYPNYFKMPMTARSEQYSIPLPVYVDKEDI